MNPQQQQQHSITTISPDFAAGPNQVIATRTEGGNSKDTTTPTNNNNNNNNTKIENPFDAFLTTTSTTTPTVLPTTTVMESPTVKKSSSSSSKNNNNWFSLMNDGAATTMLDVFQLLPSRSIIEGGSNTTGSDSIAGNMDTASTSNTAGIMQLPIESATSIRQPPPLPQLPPILLEQKRSMDTTTTANSLGFDPETYSYDEEMNAIYSATTGRVPHIPLRTLSEEETYVTNESASTSQNHYHKSTDNSHTDASPQPIVTMTSLMTSTGSVGHDVMAISRVLPTSTSTLEPPPQYHTYDYSDVAMMSGQVESQQQQQQPHQIRPNATFDSGISSIGNEMDILELAPTTSSDIIRQHQQQQRQQNTSATRMVSMGTGSVVVVETVSTSDNDDENNPRNDKTEEDDEDEQLAARIMFVLQGAAAMNSTSITTNQDHSPPTTMIQRPEPEELLYLPSDQPHISMTDSQIYTCGSGTVGDTVTTDQIHKSRDEIEPLNNDADNNNNNDDDDDDDVDNIPPASISIPLSSSLSPLSQQQQERQHIVLNPVFNYASSSDDGENEAINGFFGDTDTEDDDVIPTRIQQQQLYGPIVIPNKNVTSTAFPTDSLAPFPTTVPPPYIQRQGMSQGNDTNNSWSNATPAVAMTAAGLTGATMMIMTNNDNGNENHVILPPSFIASTDAVGSVSSPHTGMANVQPNNFMGTYHPSPEGMDSIKYRMTIPPPEPNTITLVVDDPVSSGNHRSTSSNFPSTGGFPHQQGNYNDPEVNEVNNVHSNDEHTKKRGISTYSCLLCMGLIFVLGGIALLIYFLVRNNNDSKANVLPPSPTAPTITSEPTPVTVPTPLAVPAPTTLVPSMMPTLSIRDELFLQLQNVSTDNGIALNTSNTPQHMAFTWLLSDPQLTKYSNEKRIVRYALATFYYSTGGNTRITTNSSDAALSRNTTIVEPTIWLDNYLWLSYNDECEWYTRSRTGLCGTLTSNIKNSTTSNTSNDDNRNTRVVQNLDVSYNNLRGTIPAEIGLLSTLYTFSVGGGPDTTLGGSIPSELGQLSLLKELRLPYNQITGRIPASIGECTLLQSIDLSNNRLRGLIPSDIGMMTNLVILSLDHNAFQGPIPTIIGKCTGIKTLNLAHNTLSLLPTEIYQLSNLIFLDIQNNTLRGQLEDTFELGTLSNINTILLSHNQLTGTLPTEFNALSNLKVLDLSHNAFSGTIPDAFINDNITLSSLPDSNNSSNIFSPIDNETAISTTLAVNSLRVLQLNHNRLSGLVPESFRELSSLQVLQLHSNLLNGSIPMEVCEVFNETRATVSVDCLIVDCPCCIFCCNMDEMVVVVENYDNFDDICTCRHWNTTMEWLCY